MARVSIPQQRDTTDDGRLASLLTTSFGIEFVYSTILWPSRICLHK